MVQANYCAECKLIDFWNEIIHSGDLRVTDSKMDSCIEKMIQLMSELNIHENICTELQKTKTEDTDSNFRETEVKALHNLVSSIKEKMDSLQDAQTQQMQDIEKVKDNTTETEGKVVTMETVIQGVKLEVEPLSEIYQKIKSFLANNLDIHDKNLSENIQAMEKTITALESKFEKKHKEIGRRITSMGENISGLKKGMNRKFKETGEKHKEIKKKIILSGRNVRGIKKEVKRFTRKPSIQKEMESLRNELLYRYKCFRTIPFSPIDDKEEAPIEYFYTEAVIKCEDKENAYANRFPNRERRMGGEKQGKTIKSYNRMSKRERTVENEKQEKSFASCNRRSTKERWMFKENQQENKLTSYKQIFERRKRIILTGLSGSGKSTFLKKIVNTWCKLQENKKTGICIDMENSSTRQSSKEAGSATQDTSHETGSSTYDSSNVAGPSNYNSSIVIADESVLLKFDLLFYINSPAISSEKTLTNVLCNQCIKREPRNENVKIKNKLSQLLNKQSENILIIFDGLDEMGHTPDFCVNIFKRDLYPGISVIMGMRPWKISKLGLKPLSHYDLLLDIQGFSTDNSLEFVQKVIDMNNSMYREKQEKLLSKRDREILTSFKNIPLLLLFLAHIWYREQSLPDKYKDLYNQIIDFLIRRWIKKAGNKCTVTLSDGKSDDLHLKMFWETHLSSACKAAYHFLLERSSGQSVVIPEKELRKELGDNSEEKLKTLLDCGIMSKVDDFSPLDPLNVYVKFLHMSIQEYLASTYIVQDGDAFQKFLSSIVTVNDVLRYENILICFSGLNANLIHKAFSRICEVCNEDTIVIQYRQEGDNYKFIRDLNAVYKRCVNEMNELEPVEMSDIYITSDTDYKLLMPRLRPHFARSLLIDLIRCDEINISAMTDLISLTLVAVTMSKECCRALCSSISYITNLQNLYLEDLELHDGVLELGKLINLTDITLDDVTMSGECSKSLCSSISRFNHLEKLYLAVITLHDGILDMSSLSNLTHLTLDDVTMSDECSKSLCSGISSCVHMENLHLKTIKLHDGVLSLRSLTNITSLRLDKVTVSEECSISLCNSISSCTQLKKIKLNGIALHDGVLDLRFLTSLTSFTLCCVTMSEECQLSWCSSISRCTHLEKLKLYDISLHNVVLDVKSLLNLAVLTLEDVTMSTECCRTLCSGINSCSRMEKLELTSMPLHDCLLDLDKLTNLKVVNFCKLTMSDKSCRSWCSSIHIFTHLEILELCKVTLHDAVLDLKYLPNLTVLTLDDVNMSEKCSRYLCSSMSSCTHLDILEFKSLALHDCQIDLKSLIRLTVLTLDNVTMNEESCGSLCSNISKCSYLEELKIKRMSLYSCILDLRSMTNLTFLTLNDVTMSDECSSSLFKSISSFTRIKEMKLKHISLDYCVLDLSRMTNLTVLILQKVTMSEESCISWCNSINISTHLEILDLRCITLHDVVLDLRTLTNLVVLKLDDVTMSNECSRSLCSRINNCAHLEILNLASISLYDFVIDLISLTDLTDLTLDDVTLSDECSRSLCSCINSLTCLIQIKLKNISLHDGVLDLNSLNHLRFLKLYNVTMSEKCRISFSRSISSCINLNKLYIQNITQGFDDHGSLSHEWRKTLDFSLKHCLRLDSCHIDSDTEYDSYSEDTYTDSDSDGSDSESDSEDTNSDY